jgi:AraC-like DNA-binding protein
MRQHDAVKTCSENAQGPNFDPVLIGALAIVPHLERLLAAHPGRLLQIAEICSATGTSAFILTCCCWNALGMSPGRYLSLRRLKLVRLALQNADPATTTVVGVLRE